MDFIKDNGFSQVWEQDGFIYKRQPKYLMDNEVHALTLLVPHGWVPEFYREGLEVLRMQKLVNVPLLHPIAFRHRCNILLEAIKDAGLRHGDLTRPHLFVTEGDWPMLIDWGESRVHGDPRPDKRREGDQFWMTKTCEGIISDHHEK